MADTNGCMSQQSSNLSSLQAALDPKSLILSQFSDSTHPLQLTTENLIMERGPRYKAYSDLRDAKLRMRSLMQEEALLDPNHEQENENPFQGRPVLNSTPPRKPAKSRGISNFSTPPKMGKGSSILTQSVPDFSSALRKENRKPPPMPTLAEKSKTPPAMSKTGGRNYGGNGGSKSVNSGEKRRGGLMMGRKSYANMEELKGLGIGARNAIHGENRGSVRGNGRTVLGYSRHF